MKELKERALSADDFINEIKDVGAVEQGYIAYDPEKPDHILFGYSSWYCPPLAIHKDRIKIIRRGSTHACSGNSRVKQMWDATVSIERAKTDEGQVFEALLAMRRVLSPRGASNYATCVSARQDNKFFLTKERKASISSVEDIILVIEEATNWLDARNEDRASWIVDTVLRRL